MYAPPSNVNLNFERVMLLSITHNIFKGFDAKPPLDALEVYIGFRKRLIKFNIMV